MPAYRRQMADNPAVGEHIDDLTLGMSERWRDEPDTAILILANVLGTLIARKGNGCPRCGAKYLAAAYDVSREMMFDECCHIAGVEIGDGHR